MCNILVINAGSSSLKYAVYMYENGTHTLVLKSQIDFDPTTGQACAWKHAESKHEVHAVTRDNAVEQLFSLLDKPDVVVHRIVMGGDRYTVPFAITDNAIDELERLIPLAPLHQPHNIAPIKKIRGLCPDLLQIGSLDGGFHRTIPTVRRRLAVSERWHELGVRLWGWHGHSYEYISQWLTMNNLHARRVVVAHLGSGASVCALLNRVSIDTSMSFSPLSGLLGSTRSGSLDAAAALYMLRVFAEGNPELSAQELTNMLEYELWKKSGLLGVSGITGDMRELLASSDPRAQHAVDLFCESAAKHIAQMAVSLDGVDMIVFTGGIGENSPPVRQRIVRKVAHLGFVIDPNENNKNAQRLDSYTSKPICVVRADEERIMAQVALPFLEHATQVAAE